MQKKTEEVRYEVVETHAPKSLLDELLQKPLRIYEYEVREVRPALVQAEADKIRLESDYDVTCRDVPVRVPVLTNLRNCTLTATDTYSVPRWITPPAFTASELYFSLNDRYVMASPRNRTGRRMCYCCSPGCDVGPFTGPLMPD